MLQSIADTLRSMHYLPMLFDFERPGHALAGFGGSWRSVAHGQCAQK